jgi:TonB-linked SusC/RagA family outer membrane protein
MRIFIVLTVVCYFQAIAEGFTQSRQVDLKLQNATLNEAFEQIKSQLGVKVFYRSELINNLKVVNIDVTDQEVTEVLGVLLNNTGLTYRIINDNIIIVSSATSLSASNNVSQEEFIVKGFVTDVQGDPLPGVNVFDKSDPTTGVITGVDGQYTIRLLSTDAALVYSYIGFQPQEINVNGRSGIDITLVEDVMDINEVVVVGYGSQKKVNLTGAVAQVKSDKITQRSTPTVDKALQGLAPGLVIVDRGGFVGDSKSNITIRGTTTFKGSSNPLILIDGIEQKMNDIAATDIESVSVLKDAASTSIYGSRGANGVILITTKRGTKEGLQVSYNGSYSYQTINKLPERVGIRDYMELYNEAFINDGQPAPFTEEDIKNTESGTDPYKYPNTDWHEVVFQDAPMHQHSMNFSGGNEKVKFSTSLNYLDQEGVYVANNSLKRFGIRSNMDYQITDKLKASLDFNARRKDLVTPRNQWEVNWRLFHDMPPWGLPRTKEGRYGTSLPGNNVLASLESGRRDITDDYFVFNSRLEYDLFKGFKLIGEYSNTTEDYLNNEYQEAVDLYNYDETYAKTKYAENSVKVRNSKKMMSQLRFIAEYTKKFNDHSFKAMVGAERYKERYEYTETGREKSYTPDLTAIDAYDSETDWNKGKSEEFRLGSLFGRLNYNYKEKYLLEANFRRDGSSRFAPGEDTRWSFLPSFSAGWRLSEEEFMQDITWLDQLKIRASYGKTGKQDNIGYWKYLSTISMGNGYAFGTTPSAALVAYQAYMPNEQITWETTTISNLGFDINLINKIGIVFELYNKTTDDILNDRIPIPRTTGFAPPAVNLGSVENRGWELGLSYSDDIGSDFHYDVSFMIADNTSEVTNLHGTGPYVSGWTIAKEGLPLWGYWGYETDGFYKDADDVANSPLFSSSTIPGDLKYVDQLTVDTDGDGIPDKGDGKINGDDKIYLGDGSAHLPISFNLHASYKNWDLGLFVQGVMKQRAFMNGALTEGPNYGNYTHKEMLGRWTPETAETATWPVLRKNSWKSQAESDFWIRKAAYVRLKNVQLGYTLPKSVLKKLNIEYVRVYVSGDNLLTWSQEKLIDPEFKPGRVDYVPQTKIYSIGLNLNF